MKQYASTLSPAVAGATRMGLRPVTAAAGLGALVGATGAAAHAIKEVRQGRMTNQQAVIHTAKEAAGTALATAAAVAVMGSVNVMGVLGLVGLFAVGTGCKYVWNQALTPACKALPAKAEVRSGGARKAKAATRAGKED